MKAPSPLVRRTLIAPLILGCELALLLLSPLLAALAALLSPLVGGRRPVRLLALVLAWAGGHLLSVARLLAGAASRARTAAATTRSCAGSWARSRRPRCASARVKVTVFDSERAEAVLASETPGGGALDPLRRRRLAARARPPAAPPPPAAADRDAPGAGGGPADRHARHAAPEPLRRPARRGHRGRDRDDERGPGRARRGRDLPRGRQLHGRAAAAGASSGCCTAATTSRPSRRAGWSTSPRRGPAARWRRWRARRTPTWSSWPTTASRTASTRSGASCREPTPIDVQLWHVPASELPHGNDERIRWLFGWWETLDAWVAERGYATVPVISR